MKALCMVAHPDDCVIFGYHFMHHVPLDWHICYLTYHTDSARASELGNFWHRRGITTQFLGCPDQWADTLLQQLHFDTEYYKQQILSCVNSHALVLTHNVDGDYGHIHHKFVHECVAASEVPQVYFASDFNHTLQLQIDPDLYDLTELPMHAAVIRQIHQPHTGRYIVTPAAHNLVKNYV